MSITPALWRWVLTRTVRRGHAEAASACDSGLKTAPDVLDLRIHGINNTTPAIMLDLPAAGVVRSEGDGMGDFWTPHPEALRDLTPADRGYVPPRIRREVYSWGNMTRSGPALQWGLVGVIMHGLTRVFWTMLLPFGLVNVAYWSRRLYRPGGWCGCAGQAGHQRCDADTHREFHQPYDTGGAWLFRLAGLLMTLLTAVGATTISLDVIATQCLGSNDHPCRSLPDSMLPFYGYPLSQRIALGTVFPILMILLLFVLSWWTRGRFEAATRNQAFREIGLGPRRAGDENTAAGSSAGSRLGGPPEDPCRAMPDASRGVPRWPLLSTPGFWNHSAVVKSMASAHLSATLAGLVLVCLVRRDVQGLPAAEPPGLVLAAVVTGLLACFAVLTRGPEAADVGGPSVAGGRLSRVGNAARRVAMWLGWITYLGAFT